MVSLFPSSTQRSIDTPALGASPNATSNSAPLLTLGLGPPALGMLAGHAGLEAIFLVSAVLVLCAVPMAWRLMNRPAGSARTPS